MRFVFSMILVTATIVPPAAAAETAAGKAAYAKKCASCHAVSGEGNAKIAALMKVGIRHLGSKEVQAKSDAELKKDILEGTGKMKPPKDVDAKSADALVVYLRTFAKK